MYIRSIILSKLSKLESSEEDESSYIENSQYYRWVIIERQSKKSGESAGQNYVLSSILKPMNVLDTKEC